MKGLGANFGWLVVLGALCLAPTASFADSPVRQITVTGQAEKSFAPDKADIVVVAEGRGKTLQEAKSAHDRLLNALHEVARKYGIEKTGIVTLSDSMTPQYDYVHEKDGGNRQVLRGYSAEHRLRITLDNLDRIGDFINALVARNIDRIEQVGYGLKNSDAAEMAVSVAAVKDAKNKAQKLLEALNASLGRVLTVQADGGGYAPQPMPMMMRAAKADMAMESAAPIPEGDVSIRQNVTVQFEIQ